MLYILCLYIFSSLLEVLCIYKKTNIYHNAMIGTSKYKMQSSESPIRTT